MKVKSSATGNMNNQHILVVDDEEDILELGAEDYVTKPFSPRILVARIHKVLNRAAQGPPEGSELIQRDDMIIDVRKHQVTVNGEPVVLTYTEFEVLMLLAGRPGWAFSRSQIVNSVRGYNYSVTAPRWSYFSIKG